MAQVGITQAAEALGVSVKTLTRWVKDKKVRPTSYTVGGHSRFDVEELKRSVEAIRKVWPGFIENEKEKS